MREFISKLLKYAVTGGVAAVIDAGGFALLVMAKMSIPVAACLSFCIAAFANYSLTTRFVFNRRASLQSFGYFMATALIGLSVNISVTLMGVFTLGLPPLAAKLSGIAIAFLVNFLLNRHIVFRV